MGFGYTVKSGDTYDNMMTVLREKEAPPQTNAYVTAAGKPAFVEIRRKDQPDGGLRGEVWVETTPGYGKRAGYFNIAGDGTIKRWPTATKKQIAKAQAMPARRTAYGGLPVL